MKRTLQIFGLLLAMGIAAHGQARTFVSQDGKKRFQGTLVGYEERTKTVSVRMQDRGNVVNFKLDMLSADDQAYVTAEGPSLQAGKWLNLSFERYKEKEGGDGRKFVGGYEIRVQNSSPDAIEDIQIEYLIVYRKGGMGNATELKMDRGSNGISRLRSGGDDKFQAGKIPLESGASRSMAAGKNQPLSSGIGCST